MEAFIENDALRMMQAASSIRSIDTSSSQEPLIHGSHKVRLSLDAPSKFIATDRADGSGAVGERRTGSTSVQRAHEQMRTYPTSSHCRTSPSRLDVRIPHSRAHMVTVVLQDAPAYRSTPMKTSPIRPDALPPQWVASPQELPQRSSSPPGPAAAWCIAGSQAPCSSTGYGTRINMRWWVCMLSTGVPSNP
ncbi:hypothetical protein GY45DRAFT_1330187 [Cubamyces sp. BRFM 1775]|nr:hypothetical protein GY45DRAFT_1330187 [Cubamyces sp. BRFM 1775]